MQQQSRLSRPFWRVLFMVLGIALLGIVAGIAFSTVVAFKHREVEKAEEAGFARSLSHVAIAEQLTLRIFEEISAYIRLKKRWLDHSEANYESTTGRMNQSLWEDLAENSQYLDDVFLPTHDSRLISSSIYDDGMAQVLAQSVSEAASSGLRFYVALLRPNTNQTDIRVALVARLGHADGSFAGHGIGIVRPFALSAALSLLSTPDGGVLAILRREGELIARHDAAESLTQKRLERRGLA